MLREVTSEERGQGLVFAALTMVVLMGFLALAVDGGHAYVQRRAMQNAADAGALAGVRTLAVEEAAGPAIEAATEYAVDRNGGESVDVTVDGRDVTVVAQRSFPTFFARVLDWFSLSAGARARARYGSPAQMRDYHFFPVAIRDWGYSVGQQYEIWDDKKEYEDAPPDVIVGGNRGWLNFNGGAVSNSEMKDWCTNGYFGTITAGDWINGTPGTNASAIEVTGLYRIGDTVIIPLYDGMRPGENGSGQLDYHIVSFAAFRITSVDVEDVPKRIVGTFERLYIIGPVGSPVHRGLIAIQLVQ